MSSLHQGSLLTKPRCRPFPDASPLSDCVVCPRCSQRRPVSSGSITPCCSALLQSVLGFPFQTSASVFCWAAPGSLSHEMTFRTCGCYSRCNVALSPGVVNVVCQRKCSCLKLSFPATALFVSLGSQQAVCLHACCLGLWGFQLGISSACAANVVSSAHSVSLLWSLC